MELRDGIPPVAVYNTRLNQPEAESNTTGQHDGGDNIRRIVTN